MEQNKSVSEYILKHNKYTIVLRELRTILLAFPLEESLKWGMPTYSFEHRNLFGIGAFKNHVSLWFFQGGLLIDKHKLLINTQEGKTKAMCQIHFGSIDEIDKKVLAEYIGETLKNQKKGLVIKAKKNTNPIVIPDVLLSAFDNNSELTKCFNELTTGKQREYTDFIKNAKREVTKTNRLDKIIPMILDKKGIYDKYKNC